MRIDMTDIACRITCGVVVNGLLHSWPPTQHKTRVTNECWFKQLKIYTILNICTISPIIH